MFEIRKWGLPPPYYMLWRQLLEDNWQADTDPGNVAGTIAQVDCYVDLRAVASCRNVTILRLSGLPTYLPLQVGRGRVPPYAPAYPS